MAGVTVINGTNAPINVSISIGFNREWKNRLNPFEKVELNNSFVFSLNAKYWALQQSEYGNSDMEIGMFSVGVVAGIGGLILTIYSGGSLLLFGGGALLGLFGLSSSVVSIAVPELMKTPAKVSNIEGRHNRKFLVTGKLDLALEKGVLQYSGGELIGIKELSAKEYEDYLVWHKPASVVPDAPDVDRNKMSFVSKADVQSQTLEGPVWIYPAECGVPHTNPPCWQLNAGANAVELSDAAAKTEIKWTIEYAGQYPRVDVVGEAMADAFRFKSAANGSYLSVVSTKPDASQAMKVSQVADESTMFFIVRSGWSYMFVPCSRQQTYLINDSGSLVQGTKLHLSPNTERFRSARWAIDPLAVPSHKLKLQDLAGISGYVGNTEQRVRMIPALMGDRILDGTGTPLLCIEVPNDSREPNAPLRLGERNTSSVDWQINPVTDDPSCDEFFLYSPNLGLTVGADITRENQTLPAYVSGQSVARFFVMKVMGFLCFQLKLDPSFFLFAEDVGNGKLLKWAKWDNFPRSMGRWAVVPRPVVTPVLANDQYLGVFSLLYDIRLDIGKGAMKKNTPSTTQTPATRLVIRRIDPNCQPMDDTGPVCEEHDVRIFSEDGKYYLGIEHLNVGHITPAARVTPTTKLFISDPAGVTVNPARELRYGQVIGIYSEDGAYRLEIGPEAMLMPMEPSPLGGGHALRIRSLGARRRF